MCAHWNIAHFQATKKSTQTKWQLQNIFTGTKIRHNYIPIEPNDLLQQATFISTIYVRVVSADNYGQEIKWLHRRLAEGCNKLAGWFREDINKEKQTYSFCFFSRISSFSCSSLRWRQREAALTNTSQQMGAKRYGRVRRVSPCSSEVAVVTVSGTPSTL